MEGVLPMRHSIKAAGQMQTIQNADCTFLKNAKSTGKKQKCLFCLPKWQLNASPNTLGLLQFWKPLEKHEIFDKKIFNFFFEIWSSKTKALKAVQLKSLGDFNKWKAGNICERSAGISFCSLFARAACQTIFRHHTFLSQNTNGSTNKRSAGRALGRRDPWFRGRREAEGEVGSLTERTVLAGENEKRVLCRRRRTRGQGKQRFPKTMVVRETENEKLRTGFLEKRRLFPLTYDGLCDLCV